MANRISASLSLCDVKYEIRGQLANQAQEMELLAALRPCSNGPGQWAVQTALGGFQSFDKLVQPGGRLYRLRQAVIDRVAESPYFDMQQSMGAMYAFIRLHGRFVDKLDDRAFAPKLLRQAA